MTRHPLRSTLYHLATAAVSALAIACQPLGLGTQASVPVAPPAAPPAMVLDASTVAAAKERFSGHSVVDFTRSLVSSPTRWGADKPADKKYSVQAFGDPDVAAWVGGLNLQAAPFNLAGDFVTNGMCSRQTPKYPNRVFMITRNGRFIGLDPNDPTTGYTVTNLGATFTKTYVTLSGDGGVAFVVSDAGVVYAIHIGAALATSPASHAVRQLNLGATCRWAALYADPLPPHSYPNSDKTTLHVVDNTGNAHRIGFTPVTMGHTLSASDFAGATFATLGAPVSLTTATPVNGTDRVRATPVVLNNQLVVGDRAGNVIRYNYDTATKTTTQVNYGWAIETPIAVDIDDNFTITDMFVAAGAQLVWLKADGTVYMGQYALTERTATANDATVHAGNFNTFINLTTPAALTAATDYQSFSSAVSTSTDSLALPASVNTPTSLDYNRLSHCGFLTGLPPSISAYAGKGGTQFYNYYPWDTATGTNDADPVLLSAGMTPPGSGTTDTSYPVQDGEALTGASLLSPSSIDWDDDGSSFVADTNHCQVLFNPASATSWNRWFPAGAMTNAAYNWRAGARPDGATTVAYTGTPANSPAQNNFYVFAGTLYPNFPNNDGQWSGRDQADNGGAWRRDVGNGATPPNTNGGAVHDVPAQCPANGTTGGTIARGSAINRAQGVAVGNLGLYVANRNAFNSGNPNGQILFMPRVGLPAGTYWGIANPQPGRMYVISNFIDPQGIDVWRDPSSSTHDIVFAPCMNSASPNKNKLFRLDSLYVNATTTAASSYASGAVTLATLSTTADPYDVGLDDNGNLWFAEHGTDQLRMVAKVVPATAGAPNRAWTTGKTAGTVYTIMTAMQEICSVSFAANDPQVPAGQGCMYVGLGAAPSSNPHRIVRLDETLYHTAVAGPDYGYRNTGMTATENLTMADAGDGGAGNAAAVRLAMPWRARGRYNSGNNTYETYICDRGNNRIRRIVSAASSAASSSFLSFPVPAAALGKPIYSATLTLTSRTAAGSLGIPQIGLASPYLQTGAVWSNATVAASPASFTPTRAPNIDLAINKAAPTSPSTAGPWNFTAGGTYRWRLPAQAIETSSTNTALQHIRLGMKTPVDTNSYFYPTSTGVITAPNVKSPEFYTNRNGGAAATYPRVDYTYGNMSLNYPILSPPAIYYKDGNLSGTRYVYLCNANSLWRYNVTTPADFITATNGAEVVFTKSVQGRDPAKGTVYAIGGTFQFNATPPLINYAGQVAMVDVWGLSAVSFTYHLNQFNGNMAAATTNMGPVASKLVATAAGGSVTDNAGIYLSADPSYQYAYFGLANGRIFKLSLN